MIHEIGPLTIDVRAEFPDGWPWTIVGVFPNDADDRYSWFDYTVGLGSVELWCSCYSLEGRGADNDLIAMILNVVGGGWRLGLVSYGDQVAVPLGIADEHGEWVRDETAMFWISNYRVPSRTKQVNMRGRADWTVPLIWSSPLGWPE
jgi:hypothetical protein